MGSAPRGATPHVPLANRTPPPAHPRPHSQIAKSPLSPNLAFEYAITPAGVQQVGTGPAAAAGGAALVGGSAMAIPIANQQPPDTGGGGGGYYGDGGGWGY